MSLKYTLLEDARRLDGVRANVLTPYRLAITSAPFRAVLVYRLSAAVYQRLPTLGRLLHQLNMFAHGTDIDPRSEIGDGFLLQHPVGVVIGGGTTLGRNCTLMGGVVLGRREVRGGASPLQYPQVGSDVLLGSGACVLGRVTIGDRAIVGAMALVLKDVPSDFVAVGNPASTRPNKPSSQQHIS